MGFAENASEIQVTFVWIEVAHNMCVDFLTETGLMVLAQNLRRLDQLERDSLNPDKAIT